MPNNDCFVIKVLKQFNKNRVAKEVFNQCASLFRDSNTICRLVQCCPAGFVAKTVYQAYRADKRGRQGRLSGK